MTSPTARSAHAAGRAARLRAALRQAGTPERAEHEKAYLKSELTHFGVRVPVVRALVRAELRAPEPGPVELTELVRALWAHPEHECRLAAAQVLEVSQKRLDPSVCPLLTELAAESGTWAILDILGTHVASPLLARHPELLGQVRAWLADENLWVQRLGVLSFMAVTADPGEGGRWLPVFFEAVDPLLGDRRFFIRKAIGWVARSASRHHPDAVAAWVAANETRLSTVTRREAVRHLP